MKTTVGEFHAERQLHKNVIWLLIINKQIQNEILIKIKSKHKILWQNDGWQFAFSIKSVPYVLISY